MPTAEQLRALTEFERSLQATVQSASGVAVNTANAAIAVLVNVPARDLANNPRLGDTASAFLTEFFVKGKAMLADLEPSAEPDEDAAPVEYPHD
jgi:hypothetical protein